MKADPFQVGDVLSSAAPGFTRSARGGPQRRDQPRRHSTYRSVVRGAQPTANVPVERDGDLVHRHHLPSHPWYDVTHTMLVSRQNLIRRAKD
jgi:hypothetical protein